MVKKVAVVACEILGFLSIVMALWMYDFRVGLIAIGIGLFFVASNGARRLNGSARTDAGE